MGTYLCPAHIYIHIRVAATLSDVDEVVSSNTDSEQHYAPALHINHTQIHTNMRS